MLVSIVKETVSSGAKGKAVHKVAVYLIAGLINPAFGDSYSFPWLRGPHDQIIEYNDHVPVFDQIRLDCYKHLHAFDFCKALVNIFTSEEESEHLMTKVAVFRIFTQLVRMKKEQFEAANLKSLTPPAELIIKHQMFVHTLNSTMSSSRDHILKSFSLFILHQLVKLNFRSGGVGKPTGIEALQLDANTIFKMFEDNAGTTEARVLIAVVASGLLSEMLSFEEKTSKFIQSKFTGQAGTSSLTKLVSLIDINSGGNKNEMRLLQGTNFGCPFSGFYDQPLNLLNKIQQKQMETSPDPSKADLLQGPNGNGLGDTVMAFLLNLSSKTELSPKGFISLLSFVHDVINNEQKPFMQKIFKNCLKLLCSIIREN